MNEVPSVFIPRATSYFLQWLRDRNRHIVRKMLGSESHFYQGSISTEANSMTWSRSQIVLTLVPIHFSSWECLSIAQQHSTIWRWQAKNKKRDGIGLGLNHFLPTMMDENPPGQRWVVNSNTERKKWIHIPQSCRVHYWKDGGHDGDGVLFTRHDLQQAKWSQSSADRTDDNDDKLER